MRIANMRERLEETAIDHVYYRAYDPMVRCVGREYTPNRAAQIALLVAAGRLQWTPDVVEAMYWSFNSRIDQIWNRDNSGEFFDIDEGEWDRPARADLVDAGKAPDWVRALEANVTASGNMYGLADDQGAVGRAKVLYLCDDITRAKAVTVASAIKRLLTAQGVEFVTLAKGTDGWGLYDLGLWELAEAKAKEYAGYIREVGATTVVANNPAVVYALREWYPKLGLEIEGEVLHHTEYLDRLGVSGKFSGRVTLHDSSYQGRYLGIFDAPRNLLKRVDGLELVECYFARDKANPTGPLYAFFDEGFSKQVAARRAAELALSAPVVVTTDPASKRNLGAVAEESGINIQDVAEVLAG
ncbi:MAG: (Fe-S)-binding protein [Isosphaeraceae bacterium]